MASDQRVADSEVPIVCVRFAGGLCNSGSQCRAVGEVRVALRRRADHSSEDGQQDSDHCGWAEAARAGAVCKERAMRRPLLGLAVAQ